MLQVITQRTESLNFKTESVLKKYLIVPAYLNFRNDLNVVLNFSVDIIRFRRQKLHTEIFSIQYTEKWKLKNQAQIKKKNIGTSRARTQHHIVSTLTLYPLHHTDLHVIPIRKR